MRRPEASTGQDEPLSLESNTLAQLQADRTLWTEPRDHVVANRILERKNAHPSR